MCCGGVLLKGGRVRPARSGLGVVRSEAVHTTSKDMSKPESRKKKQPPKLYPTANRLATTGGVYKMARDVISAGLMACAYYRHTLFLRPVGSTL